MALAGASRARRSMAVRSGQQFKAGLEDGREVWYDDKRVEDVTTFPENHAAVQSFAELYDQQHDPAYRAVSTCEMSELGLVGCVFEMPRAQEQQHLTREAYTIWARADLLDVICDAALREVDPYRRWTTPLVQLALEQKSNLAVFDDRVAKWAPLTDAAIDAYCSGIQAEPPAAVEAKREVWAFCAGLGPPA